MEHGSPGKDETEFLSSGNSALPFFVLSLPERKMQLACLYFFF